MKFFSRAESLIAVDIGASGVRILEVEAAERPIVKNIGFAPFKGDVFSNNLLTKGERVSEQLVALLENNSIADKRAVVSLPSPSVFTKKIQIQKVPYKELAANITFEAGSYVPHPLEAVKLDYHVLGEAKNHLDVLIVAVKNEIVDSYLDALGLAGVEVAVADIDYFALQNMCELSYPELFEKTVAIVNIGARFTTMNICRAGQSLCVGDLAVGGKYYTESIAEALDVKFDEAEALKLGGKVPDEHADAFADVVDRCSEYVGAEVNRQLSFLWNATGADGGIETILVSGGGARVKGLIEEIGEKTGLPTALADPFRGFDCAENIDREYLNELAPLMGVVAGMSTRTPGDKERPTYEV